MDPALLNYLQNSQASNQMSGTQQPIAPQQSVPQQPMQQAGTQQQQAPYNPFDSGIQKAIASARMSLGMNKDQQENAFNNSLLAFGDSMSQIPKEKGFLNNLGSIGRALSPALKTYDQSENAAMAENQNMANQILQYQAAQQARQAQQEERLWHRKHAENQLGEQRRYHDLMMGGGLRGMQGGGNGEFIPIRTKTEKTPYLKDKKNSGEILKELSTIKKYYDEFRESAKDDIIDPMNPYIGKAVNTTKDLFGYFSGDEHLRDETIKRKALDAKLEKFTAELDQKIKHGVLTKGMVELFENKDLFPSLRNDPKVFEQKLNDLTEEMVNRYETADLSLKYKVHLDPYNLDQFKNYLNPQQQTAQEAPAQTPTAYTADESSVSLYNPKMDEETEAHPDDVAAMEQLGWQRI